MSSRPPDQTSPSSSSSSSSSPTTTTRRRTRLRKLSDTIRFSLRKPTTTTYVYFLSLLNRFLSKTLDFLSMDSLLFPPDDDDTNTNDLFLDRSLLTPHPSSSSSSLPIEQLYFVPYRWWSEARESLFGDSGEVKGVLYAAEWSDPRLGTMGIWGYDSKFEISLNLRREDCSRKSDCGEQGDYALIAEWMFLRTLKWHSDGMEVGGFIAAEDNMQDLFPLRIRLSVLWETNLLVVKISQKDNKISAFSRACDIFCVESGLLSIWDFSGQTTQIFTHDRNKLPDVSDQPDEEGELALLFGDLLRKLWAPGATPVAPRAFKSKLSAFAPQFSGYNQHDSQEFLAFLLDGLHEDLNRVKYKPYIEAKEAEDRPDEEVADEHWRNHLARNDSIIVDVCQGQYRSKLVCPACKKLSVTFDPFMYLSLPLPSTTMRSMTLTVMSTDGSTLPFPVTVTVPKYGRCKDLVQALSTTCSLRDDEKLLVAEIFNNRILHFLDKPSDSIELIRDNDLLVAYRLPKDSETSSLVVFMHEQVERHFLHATSSSKRFGIPLVARISDLSRGSEIRIEFLKLLNSFLMRANEDIDMEDVISSRLSDRDVNSDSGSGDDSHLGPDDFQFYLMEERGGLLSKVQKMQMNETVTISELTRTINVLVSWPDKMTKLYDTCLLSSLPQICKPGLLTKEPQESVSLYKCLEAFLKEEPLGPEDMWYCPNCKKHRQASKKLDLWRLPEILIIHLKRFSYNRVFKNKLETFVDFPIDDFDLSTYIVHQSAQVSHRYVLYAVSNHYGGMGGGHYTAFVQLGRDRWYEFDDSLVSPASEEQIKTSAAYVLFYRRIPDV
ncbi:Ubiquitin carboxyl-terminal hydrolase 8 [Camellia lanceoleosa]|uniref:Ubiquitin carboxyl-terminal hydrolase 8 n=1 Tax=Camellia lanceoleosa TaxID=1840588 RepID=A0ACC0FWE6_9ERIC|nr:Ubiquitin carboxyl-terminal hydrolase 8 [Camellia lanceoleosa]